MCFELKLCWAKLGRVQRFGALSQDSDIMSQPTLGAGSREPSFGAPWHWGPWESPESSLVGLEVLGGDPGPVLLAPGSRVSSVSSVQCDHSSWGHGGHTRGPRGPVILVGLV